MSTIYRGLDFLTAVGKLGRLVTDATREVGWSGITSVRVQLTPRAAGDVIGTLSQLMALLPSVDIPAPA